MAGRLAITDAEVLERARSVFVERGYAARTKQVAAAVGLTWGAIALRFGNKRALFTQAMAGPDEPACPQRSTANLPGLLARLRTHLWERWPQRLQLRLAAQSPHAARLDDETDGLVQRLAAVLEVHARGGSIRSDVRPETLARVVIALIIGDVAQRFVAGERATKADRALIDSVVCLLAGNSTRG